MTCKMCCILLGLCLWTSSVSAQNRPAYEDFAGELSGKIVFQSDRDGDLEIYMMNANRGRLFQLTHNSVDDSSPAWSPDGGKIAFTSARSGNADLFVMNSDGSEQIQLTRHPARDEAPSWSPDGKRLAFHSDRDGEYNIYILDISSQHLQKFTDSPGQHFWPAWSPNAASIAYFTEHYQLNWGIEVMALNKTRQQRLTGSDGLPRAAWHPDAKLLAYLSSTNSLRTNIWLMNSDGSDRRQLTYHKRNYTYDPAWSPNGQYIIYVVSEETEEQRQNSHLCVIAQDGSKMSCFMEHPARNEWPDWHQKRIQ